jgi:hypothetical protein
MVFDTLDERVAADPHKIIRAKAVGGYGAVHAPIFPVVG